MRELAKAVGIHESGVVQLRNGYRMPSVQNAARFADALTSPHLLTLCTKLRTTECTICGKAYVEDHAGGHKQLACSPRCKWNLRYRRERKTRWQKLDFWRRRFEDAQALIDEMCWDCEPEGACRTPECPLRDGSPLPLLGEVSVGVPQSGSIVRRVPEGRQKHRRDYRTEWARRKRRAQKGE